MEDAVGAHELSRDLAFISDPSDASGEIGGVRCKAA